MLIDWFTVVAQIANFLVLVALLKHFLWSKLTRAIDEREARVAGELAKAEKENQEAKKRTEELRLRSLEQDQTRDEMMAKARKEADDQRAKLVEEARASVRELEKKWHEDLDRERSAFFSELRTRAATEILVVIRRVLQDLSSTDLRQSTIQAFLDKLGSLDAATLRELGTQGQVVRSAGDLSNGERGKIAAILEARSGVPAQLKFEQDPTMGWGIELRGNGHKIGWASEDYLDSLEEKLKQALNQRAGEVDRVTLPVRGE